MIEISPNMAAGRSFNHKSIWSYLSVRYTAPENAVKRFYGGTHLGNLRL